MTDIDMDLKRALDERLAGFVPPARTERRGPSRVWRLLVGTGIASIVFAGAGLAMDVQSVAAANGGECANLLAKIELWYQKVSGTITPEDFKKDVAKIARVTTCEGGKPMYPVIDKGGAVDQKAPARSVPPMSNWD